MQASEERGGGREEGNGLTPVLRQVSSAVACDVSSQADMMPFSL